MSACLIFKRFSKKWLFMYEIASIKKKIRVAVMSLSMITELLRLI